MDGDPTRGSCGASGAEKIAQLVGRELPFAKIPQEGVSTDGGEDYRGGVADLDAGKFDVSSFSVISGFSHICSCGFLVAVVLTYSS